MLNHDQPVREQVLVNVARQTLQDSLFKLAMVEEFEEERKVLDTSDQGQLGAMLQFFQRCPERDLSFSVQVRDSLLATYKFEVSQDPEHKILGLIEGFKKLEGCDQGPKHQEGDALNHTALVFGEMANILRGLASEGLVSKSECYVLLIASLIHDIEKPSTRAETPDPKALGSIKVTFFNHEKRAAERCEDLGRKFGLTQEEIATLRYIVENHMRVHRFLEDGVETRLELLKQGGQDLRNFRLLVIFQAADARATWLSPDGEARQEALVENELFGEKLNQTIDSYRSWERAEEIKALERQLRPIITQILSELNVPKGPVWGECIRRVTEILYAQGPNPNTSDEYIKRVVEGILQSQS